METINLAHGSFFALGMYVALIDRRAAVGALAGARAAIARLPLGARYALALVLAPIVVGVFGMLLELALRRTYGKDPLYGLLLTFGAALVIEEVIRVVWGSTEKQLPLPEAISGAVACRRPDLRQVPLLRVRRRRARDRAAVAVPREDAVRRASSRPARTTARWCARSASTCRGCGCCVFALGVALAAFAGVVMAPIWGIRPHVGVDAVVPAFLIIVLGGVGSFWGAVVAGAAGRYGRRPDRRLRRPSGRSLSMYLLFIAVVTFRARGLFGKQERARCLSLRDVSRW